MRFIKKSLIPVFVLFLLVNISYAETEPQGVDPEESYKMVMNDLSSTFIIDVRTKAEYEFVGHPDLPNGVPNIPIKFYPTWKVNKNFVEDVEKRFRKDDTIITICRSGKRAKAAARLLTESGFKNIFYMKESFEGPKDSKGHRTVSGWKVNELPYTYKLEKHQVYNK